MQIPILLEPVTNNGYRATCGSPFAVSVEGATRDEAVEKLEAAGLLLATGNFLANG